MARTAQFELPLVMPAQAQKHVTVNEALARLDAVAQLRVVSSQLSEPPVTGTDGASYLVPNSAVGAWIGRVGHVAVWCNGGWLFIPPRTGWRAWDESRPGPVVFDGSAWRDDAVAISPSGAVTSQSVVEFEHIVVAGTSNLTLAAIPPQAQVIGVTGRVISALSGPGLTGWSIGVGGAANRYGTGLGLALNSYLVGLSGAPVTYYPATPLQVSAEGGSFTSGLIRLAIHCVGLAPPRSI